MYSSRPFSCSTKKQPAANSLRGQVQTIDKSLWLILERQAGEPQNQKLFISTHSAYLNRILSLIKQKIQKDSFLCFFIQHFSAGGFEITIKNIYRRSQIRTLSFMFNSPGSGTTFHYQA
ncbi:MAG: hypothetical protein KJ893_05170 [Candidatus Omnitrophica bacterium]|nr:hypothetical protein [Candidatus Omnitrophota bacterium]MBU4478214.1 hypothetical protein [Candidatus Omnitrophota bacterium]